VAEVQLGRYEAEEGALPPVCIRCGQPATSYKARQLSWLPALTNLLLLINFWPYLLALAFFWHQMTLLAPFCDRHTHYWARRRVFTQVTVILLISVMLGGLLIYFSSIDAGASGLGMFLFLSWAIGLIWLAGIGLLRWNALRPVDMTEETMTLTGVAPAFASRLRKEKRQAAAHFRIDPNGQEAQGAAYPRLRADGAAGRQRPS
jgi:hypothetical protein